MPLFFIVSGVVFSVKNDFKLFLGRRFKSLIIPVFIFSVIAFFVKIFVNFYYAGCEVFGIRNYIGGVVTNLPNTLLMTSNSSFSEYWFFPVLFMAQILLYRLVKMRQRYIPFILFIAIVINRILFIKSIILPFGIRESFLAILYLCVGYYFIGNKDINIKISKYQSYCSSYL